MRHPVHLTSSCSTAGAVLDDALEDLGACLRDNFGARGESRTELIDSFARDHS